MSEFNNNNIFRSELNRFEVHICVRRVCSGSIGSIDRTEHADAFDSRRRTWTQSAFAVGHRRSAADIQEGLARGSLLRVASVSWTGSLSAQVRQLLFALEGVGLLPGLLRKVIRTHECKVNFTRICDFGGSTVLYKRHSSQMNTSKYKIIVS